MPITWDSSRNIYLQDNSNNPSVEWFKKRGFQEVKRQMIRNDNEETGDKTGGDEKQWDPFLPALSYPNDYYNVNMNLNGNYMSTIYLDLGYHLQSLHLMRLCLLMMVT